MCKSFGASCRTLAVFVADLRYLEKYKPVDRAREVYRLKRIFDPNYSEAKEREQLMNSLRVQKHRLELTLKKIEAFCGKDITKLSAFETLVKTKSTLGEKTEKGPHMAVAIAVVRPQTGKKGDSTVPPPPEEKKPTVEQVGCVNTDVNVCTLFHN